MAHDNSREPVERNAGWVADWLDQHQIRMVRTHATTLDGPAIGKYLNRLKFLDSLPEGHGIADMALGMDLEGMSHLTFWHAFRNSSLGDILLKPDLNTLVQDSRHPGLGHCLADFTQVDGAEISLCPRTMLRKVADKIMEKGYTVKAAFELEFFLFNTSFADARRGGYKNLEPVGASTMSNIYLLKNAYHAGPLMDQVVQRLDAHEIEWESWSDEAGVGQIELNFTPQEPVRAADNIARARQIIYECAVDLGMSATFMAQPGQGYCNGLHIHHSLQHAQKDTAAFYAGGGRSDLLLHWIAGIIKTMPGATSYLCPSINSYRRMQDFSAQPVLSVWGEENKTAALRVISRAAKLARVEHRLAAGDANPYLALAVILAGGLAGLNHQLHPPDEMLHSTWGLPDDQSRLPRTLMKAARALKIDPYLGEVVGQDVIDYWLRSRRSEWLSFHKRGAIKYKKTRTLLRPHRTGKRPMCPPPGSISVISS